MYPAKAFDVSSPRDCCVGCFGRFGCAQSFGQAMRTTVKMRTPAPTATTRWCFPTGFQQPFACAAALEKGTFAYEDRLETELVGAHDDYCDSLSLLSGVQHLEQDIAVDLPSSKLLLSRGTPRGGWGWGAGGIESFCDGLPTTPLKTLQAGREGCSLPGGTIFAGSLDVSSNPRKHRM